MEMGKRIKWLKLLIVMVLIICIILSHFPTLCVFPFCMVLMLYCTYRFAKDLLMNEKLKKVVCVEWWIYTVSIYLFLNYDENRVNVGQAFIVSIALILFLFRLLIIYFKINNWKEAIRFAVLCVMVLFIFSVALVNVVELFWGFKLVTIFMIVSIIKNTEHTNRFWGIVIVCLSYVSLIIMCGMLNSNFLLAPVAEAEVNFYVAVKNLYSLPEVECIKSSKEIKGYIFDFILCRIMDAVVISRLIDIFNEKDLGWFEKRRAGTNDLN